MDNDFYQLINTPEYNCLLRKLIRKRYYLYLSPLFFTTSYIYLNNRFSILTKNIIFNLLVIGAISFFLGYLIFKLEIKDYTNKSVVFDKLRSENSKSSLMSIVNKQSFLRILSLCPWFFPIFIILLCESKTEVSSLYINASISFIYFGVSLFWYICSNRLKKLTTES